MARYYICIGDKASNGAVVKTGSPTSTYNGKIRAINNSVMECPVCQSTGYLKVDAARNDTSPEGEIYALHGDFCICKCRPAPTLLASQTTYFYDMNIAPVTNAPAVLGMVEWSATGTPWKDDHNQHFHLVDEKTGLPLKNCIYELTCNGKTIKGMTDENGLTVAASCNSLNKIDLIIYNHSSQI